MSLSSVCRELTECLAAATRHTRKSILSSCVPSVNPVFMSVLCGNFREQLPVVVLVLVLVVLMDQVLAVVLVLVLDPVLGPESRPVPEINLQNKEHFANSRVLFLDFVFQC